MDEGGQSNLHMPGIVVHQSKVVYWFIPKNACTTLKTYFADLMGIKYTIVHDAPFEITRQVIPGYFNFAIIRHPVPRLWSLYKDKLKPDGRTDEYYDNGVHRIVLQKFGIFHKGMTFDEFVSAVISIKEPDDHFGLQCYQIPKEVELFKLENTLLFKIFPKRNATEPPGYIPPETIGKIINHYREDFLRFQYEPGRY